MSLPKSQFLSIAGLWTYRGAVCFLFVPYWLVLTQMSDFRIIWIEAQTMQILNFLMQWGVAFLLVLLGIFCWWMPARLQDVRPRVVWNRDERIPALLFWRLMRDAQPEAEQQKSRGMIKIGLSMAGVGVLLLLILWLIPK